MSWWSLSLGWILLLTVGLVTATSHRLVAVLPSSTRRQGGISAAAAAMPTTTTTALLRGGGPGGLLQRSASTATDTTRASCGVGPWQLFCQTILDARRHLTAAAIARSTSIFAMYPADAIKTRLQMKQPLRWSDGLYKGVGGSLLGQVPYGVLTFGSYELYKGYLLDRWPTVPPIFKYAAAAVLGDLTGSGWLCTCGERENQMARVCACWLCAPRCA
jgi:Mitochondrial carrier protein